MLLVAQRVIAPAHNVQGVNAYHYRHGRTSWPDDPRPMFDDPNKILARKNVQLRPGGNQVISFLDVAAPEDIGVEELVQGLMSFTSQESPFELPAERIVGRCAIRFGVERRLLPLWRGEFDDLARHLLAP